MAEHVLDMAKKCLQCKNPGCQKGCPIGTPIKDMINLLLQGNINKAGEILFENNPLSVICSVVCPHENQCEGNCVLGIKSSSVKISNIENYISNYTLKLIDLKPKAKREGNIGIIGSGPAGITIALLLALEGYNITIFEAKNDIGGMLRYGIPEFRLPKDVLDKIKNRLEELGVIIRPNILVGSVITIEELFRDGFDALFIATGLWKPNKLNIKGESLGHVHYAIDYLREPGAYKLGNKVCVIGAGNVAMDVARTAIRKGSKEVTIMFRGGFENMTATKHEIEYAKLDGVKFELYKNPVEVTKEGIVYVESKIVSDEDGERYIAVDDSKELFECDSIIAAVSQGPRTNIISTTKGIEVNERGLPIVDEDGRTTKEGVFASGDVVTGARTVVEAVKYSKHVAEAIDKYVSEKYEKKSNKVC
ncbi:TPA: NAD(P)-dependent oxidoreductase [Bacillus anthracis]|nr:NAD(P)-dependent oxidoreductase [Bacillus anthracis]